MTPTLAQALNLLNLYNVHQLRHELEQLQPGQPRAQSFDGPRTTTGQGPADPTSTAATTPNTAAADLAAYQRHIDQLYRCCLALAVLADRHIPTHEPRRRTIANDTRGCALHERAGIDQHQPARVTTDFASVLDVPLKEPIPVCHACQDFTRRHHQTPTAEQIIRHHRTGKWTQRTTGKRGTVFAARALADEWDRRTG